ncbi:MAG: ABC transporter permease [Candidatus Acidiferrum sp.]
MNWLKQLFSRRRLYTDLSAEMRQHLEEKIDEFVAAGLPRKEASAAARREFGNLSLIENDSREVWQWPSIESFFADVRYALRVMRKNPGFSFITVLTLALGIGANTTIFSIVDSVFLRPLPVKDPGQLAVLGFRQGTGPLLTLFSIADFRDIRSQTTGAFSDMLGYQLGFDGISLEGKADRALTNYVTGNFFEMLDVKPYLGRLIIPSEGQTLGADPVIVLSYSYWKTRFAGDPEIVGRRVLVNGHPATVIGVSAPEFYGLYHFASVQAYLPIAMLTTYESGWPRDFMVNRILQNLDVVTRLKPHVALPKAAAELSVVARRLSSQYPDTDKGMTLSAYPERLVRPDPDSGILMLKASGLFLALVILVLLLACANVANILLVRATTRERELAVRAALGAGRSRLLRQLLTESVLLAFLGGAAGILLGLWGSKAIASIQLHVGAPVHMDFTVDWRVFTYAFAVALFAGIFVGLFPALRASRTTLNTVLRESGRGVSSGKNRLRTGLVVLQVAGSLTLLVIASLFTKSLANLQHADLGFDPHHVVDFTMDPSEIGYSQTQGLAFYKSLLERLRTLPGVESVSLVAWVPMTFITYNDYLKVSDYQTPSGEGSPLVFYNVVSAGYLDTMRIPILRGRGFTETDRTGAPFVAIVSEAFARDFWPGQNPLGKHFAKVSGVTNPTYQVIGVAKDSRFAALTGPIEPYFYLPVAQDYDLAPAETLQVRSAAPPATTIRDVQAVIRGLAPGLPVFNVETMTESLDTLTGFLLFQISAGFAAALGLLGLLLALVGVYGVISYSVSQRTHEIGIRVALGGQHGEILKLILRHGLFIVSAGLAIGCVCAFTAAHLIASLLAGVSHNDPATYLVVTTALGLVALLACYIPARRATRVDPLVALRYE